MQKKCTVHYDYYTAKISFCEIECLLVVVQNQEIRKSCVKCADHVSLFCLHLAGIFTYVKNKKKKKFVLDIFAGK